MANEIQREVVLDLVVEARGYLPTIRQGIENFAAGETGAIEDAYRQAHIIKGVAAMVGQPGLSHIASKLELAFEEVVTGMLSPTPHVGDTLLAMASLLESYLDAIEQGNVAEQSFIDEVNRLDARLRQSDATLSQPQSVLAVVPSRHSIVEAAPEEVLPELLEVFQMEATDHLAIMTAALPALQRDLQDKEVLQEIRRSAHTLKGAAAMVGFRSVTQLAHRMEDALDLLYEDKLEMTPEVVALIADSTYALEDLTAGKQVVLPALYARLDYLLDSATHAEQTPRVENKPRLPLPAVKTPSMPTPSWPKPNLPVEKAEEVPLPLPEPMADSPTDDEVMPELLEVFQEEAAGHLAAMVAALPILEKLPDDKNALQEIRRSAHTLKGAAATVGFRSVTQLAHRMEDALDLLYEDKLPMTPETLTLLADSTNALEDLTARKSVALGELYARLDLLLQSDTPQDTGAAQAEAQNDAEQEKAAEQSGPVLSDRRARVSESLDSLVKLVSEQVIARTVFEQRMSDFLRLISELQPSTARLRRVSYKLETQYEASALGNSGSGGFHNRLQHLLGGHGFDELEFDRYNEFHLLTRELAETANDIQTLTGELGHLLGDFDGYLTQQARLTSEIEDKLMRMRMVPFATMTSRLHRTVRQVATERGKQVELILEGENTGLDKNVLEEMGEPLLHLLRNAVDHGIESPDVRRASGKPTRGQIHLRAAHEGSQVVLRIRDDGVGIDPMKIREAAVRKGFLTEAEAGQLSDQEALALIFKPGFSTAQSVSEISGRGVGMDIVKTRLTRLKGTLSVESQPGRGTSFTIRLPLTLAITRALLVKANQETFAIPMDVIRQILRIERSEIQMIGGAPSVRVAGRFYSVVYLSRAMALKQPADETVTKPPVLILQSGERTVALVVDHLMGGREIVVKTLGTHLKRVRGVTGATLLGDGSVVLILNPAELVSENATVRRGASFGPGVGNAELSAPKAAKKESDWTIMVVDDSPSVRRVVVNLLQRTGWKSTTAKNGLEALELLEGSTCKPDLILLDVEMPKMDGYEFLSTIRANPAHSDLPVVMLTSRSGEKHRTKAVELGVTDYLIKPYEDEKLLATIRRHIDSTRQVVNV